LNLIRPLKSLNVSTRNAISYIFSGRTRLKTVAVEMNLSVKLENSLASSRTNLMPKSPIWNNTNRDSSVRKITIVPLKVKSRPRTVNLPNLGKNLLEQLTTRSHLMVK
jgi:hypothetical protein